MDNSEMNTVVSNVADRIGVAAERLVPVAERMVSEMALRYWIFTATMGLVALSMLGIMSFVFRRLGKVGGGVLDLDDGEKAAARIFVVAVGIILFLAFSITALDYLGHAMSPAVSLLEELK